MKRLHFITGKLPAFIALMLVFALALPLFACIPASAANAEEQGGESPTGSVSPKTEFRGVWVSSIVNLDWPSKSGLSISALKNETLYILENAVALGFNAIILQVRPCGDAIYKSSLYPWSAYVTGIQGKAPADGFDPLKYWIDEAHKRGLQLHAWVNPFRVTMGSPEAPQHNTDALAATNPARLHPEWVVIHTDGRMYLNPGIPEARELIIDGVEEIVQNYEVDGIHFDDYFYPGASFNDSDAFNTYGDIFNQTVDNWRRSNVDELILNVRTAIKALKPLCQFGVSPAGIWRNKSSSPLGSDTRGNQSYSSSYADTRKWVQSKWLDYIVPQIYWHIGYDVADYSILVKWWSDVVAGTGVKLYTGNAAYRVDQKSATVQWRTPAQITDQLELNRKTANVSGSVMFRFKSIASSPALYAALKQYFTGTGGTAVTPPAVDVKLRDIKLLAGSLSVNMPAVNIITTLSSYYIMGCSDPRFPLYVNGKAVTGRSPSGYFGYLVPLTSKVTTVRVTQAGKTVTRTFTKGSYNSNAGGSLQAKELASKPGPSFTATAQIVSGSAYPSQNVFYMGGQKAVLRCTAPIGATVKVTLGGKTITMNPATKTKPDNKKIYTTTFSCTFAIPSYSYKASVISIGKPVYKMTYGGKTYTQAAKYGVFCMTSGATLYAVVTAETAKIYPGSTSSGGPSGEVAAGQIDSVTGANGDYVRLGCGKWIYYENVRVYTAPAGFVLTVGATAYSTEGKYETFSLKTGAGAMDFAQISGNKLVYRVYNVRSAKSVSLPSDSMFSSVTAQYAAATKTATYVFTLKSGQEVQGFYSEVETGYGLRFHIKKKPVIENSEMPLEGLTILIDPGHGGYATGTVGPEGYNYPEKEIALRVSLKLQKELESKGASVLLTREDDSYIELQSGRLDISRNLKTDLFISIHCNSMTANIDCNKVAGGASFYYADTSKRLAQVIYDVYTADLGLKKTGLRKENFAVVNNFWCPANLLEIGFLPNPSDAELQYTDAGQNKIAKAAAKAIIKYFTD